MFENEILTIDSVLPDLKANNKKQAFQMMTEQAACDTGLNADRLMARLMAWERRAVMSGVGGGVAILHLPLKKMDHPYIMLARAPYMIDYGAVDGAPVDLLALLLLPEKDGPYNLQRLARLSRLLRNPDLCARLRNASTEDAIQALMMNSSIAVKKAA